MTPYCRTHQMVAADPRRRTVPTMDATARLECHDLDGQPVDLAAAITAVFDGTADPDTLTLCLTVEPDKTS